METIKIKAITVIGIFLLLIGLAFIILPGPAIVFIPLGLALMSFEYPIAKKWLRKYQRYSSKAAQQMDRAVAKYKR